MSTVANYSWFSLLDYELSFTTLIVHGFSRSAYFQQIEGDVQQHAECILETKVAIECFETSDMDHLLRFHESVEIQLEDLTDETQVGQLFLLC